MPCKLQTIDRSGRKPTIDRKRGVKVTESNTLDSNIDNKPQEAYTIHRLFAGHNFVNDPKRDAVVMRDVEQYGRGQVPLFGFHPTSVDQLTRLDTNKQLELNQCQLMRDHKWTEFGQLDIYAMGR